MKLWARPLRRRNGYISLAETADDEGHYAAPNMGPLKFVVYENKFESRLSDPHYGYTFANSAAVGHDWVDYYPGYHDAYVGVMNNVSYYEGDGGGSAFVNISSIPAHGSVVFYWVYGMSALGGAANGLYAQLLIGSVLAPNFALPPTYSFFT